ncbi:MAG TPA: PAS domain S-box protein [Hyphomicrobiaceae bacterium]|nr:PAS domain S-box protein [Hyphomicrobiaceae bacterium]
MPTFLAAGSLIDLLPAAIYTTDPEGRITYYNEAAAKLWGCRPELGESEFCGSWRLYHPDGTPMPHELCPMAIALRERRPVHGMEAVAERPDGTRVPFLPYPSPLFDPAGRLVGAVNMLVDLSEHKRWEARFAKRAQQQTALYRFTDRLYRAATRQEMVDAALEAVADALDCDRASVLLLDGGGVMRFAVSRGLSEPYRRAVEGHSPWPPQATDPQPIVIEDAQAANLAPELTRALEAEGIRAVAFIPLVADNRLIGKIMMYDEAPRSYSADEIEPALTIARQLSFGLGRIAAEQARARAEAEVKLLTAIVEESEDAIISKDLSGIITSWNRGAERLFGYTPREAIGKPGTLLIPVDRHNEEPEILDRIGRGERVPHYETVRVAKDGSLIDVSLSVSPIRDALGNVIGASKIARDISERKRAQARQELLAREIQHRTKNIYSVVQAVVARSFAGKRTVEEAQESVLARLRSLAQTHALLVEAEWQGADLADVVRAELSPYPGRADIAGPSLVLSARAAQDFALALHELATNAAKYGALSNATGQVHITWSIEGPEQDRVLALRWQERGGPPVKQPTGKGFGSAVLEHVMAAYSEAPSQIEFDPEGVRYEVRSRLSAITD